MTTTIHAELLEFLDKHFPGSTIDNGYHFVSINAPAVSPLVRADAQQRVADKFCTGRYWLLSVDIDPQAFLKVDRIEQRTVFYRPDWNVEEKRTQWLAELRETPVDISTLNAERQLASAFALFEPDRNLVFDIHDLAVYAISKSDLDEFMRGLEECFDPRWK